MKNVVHSGPKAMSKKITPEQAVNHHGKHSGGRSMSKTITADEATSCKGKKGPG
jgi:hypothetical protein